MNLSLVCFIHNLLVANCKLEREAVSEGDVGLLPVRTPVSEELGFQSARGPSLGVVSEDDSQAGNSV